MKKLLYFLMFLSIGAASFSQNQEKLPRAPWEDIVEMNNNRYNSTTKWDTDVYVSLEGNYTQKDSLIIGEILKKLNTLTETIYIQFSKSEKPNFEIKFLDTALQEGNSYINSRYGSINMGEG